MHEIQVYRMAGTREQTIILQALRQGTSIELARDFAGISPEELSALINYNPDFKRAITEITAGATLDLIQRIRSASDPAIAKRTPPSERPDWKAAAWLLERSPTTRNEFSQKIEVKHTDLRDLLRKALIEANNGTGSFETIDNES